MPKLFTSSKEQPSAKVLRIQHVKHGYGPYTGNDEVQSIMEGSNLPSPQTSKGWSEEDISHLEDPKIPKKFGFVNEEQMHQTVSPEKLKALKQHGYEPVWVDASHIWHGDGKQVFFTPTNVEAKAKQAEDSFKQKTKFKEFSPEEIKNMNTNINKSLEEKLLEIKDLLEKGMNNSGIGGVGAVKAGAVLPSISKLPKPGNASLAGKVKIPGVAQPSKKNPIASAEQIHNKDIKDIKMKEAQAAFKMNGPKAINKAESNEDLYHIHKNGYRITSEPMTLRDIHEKHGGVKKLESDGFRVIQHKPEQIKLHKNGQWELDKSYDKRTTAMPGVSEMGIEVRRSNPEDKSYSKVVSPEKHAETAKEIARQNIKETKEIKPKLVKSFEEVSEFIKNGDLVKARVALGSIFDFAKSGYKGYTIADNVKRKANNTGETTGIHTMDSIKQYGGSGPNAAAREASEMRRKSKKNPVKIYTKEEIEQLQNEKDKK